MAESDSTRVKTCKRCLQDRPATREFFSAAVRGIFGLHAWCKPCCAEARRLDRAARPERYAQLEQLRYEREGEKRRAANRAIWAKNGAAYRQAAVPRIEENREKYNEARRRVLVRDRERIAKIRKAWRQANAESIRESQRMRWKSASIQKRLRVSIGAAVYRSLKRQSSSKGGSGWQQLVGYTVEQLKRHLERQFLKGMTWDNYGPAWHIDHIIPVAAFSVQSAGDEEFRHCWALTNLRPLWAKDNLRKRALIQYLI